jgi:hypothetical protein
MNKHIEEVNLNKNINQDWENVRCYTQNSKRYCQEKKKKTATRGIQIWNTDKAQKIKEKKQSYWAFL